MSRSKAPTKDDLAKQIRNLTAELGRKSDQLTEHKNLLDQQKQIYDDKEQDYLSLKKKYIDVEDLHKSDTLKFEKLLQEKDVIIEENNKVIRDLSNQLTEKAIIEQQLLDEIAILQSQLHETSSSSDSSDDTIIDDTMNIKGYSKENTRLDVIVKLLNAFIDTRLSRTEGQMVKCATFHDSFQTYMREKNVQPLSKREIKYVRKHMTSIGLKVSNRRDTYYYTNIIMSS